MTTIVPIDNESNNDTNVDGIKDTPITPSNKLLSITGTTDKPIIKSAPVSNHMKRDTTITKAYNNKQCIPYVLSCCNPAFYWASTECVAHCWCAGHERIYHNCGRCCVICVLTTGPCCIFEYAHGIRGCFGVDYSDFFSNGIYMEEIIIENN